MMKPIASNITRCLGEGHTGRTCVMRQHCRRYLDRNRGTERGTVSMAMMLYIDNRYSDRIDVERPE